MVAWAIHGLIRLYQAVSRFFIPRTCRFYPSCSQYALEAVDKYGAVKGVKLALFRIGRCSPLHPGGFDPLR